MQRTHRSVPASPAPIFDSTFQLDAASYSSGVLDFAHTLFTPLHYEPGYAYPLLVWLHGRGDDERQLQRIMPLISMRNYVAVAPRGLPLSPADGSAKRRYDWQQTDDQIKQAGERVFAAVEMATHRLHVAPRRVFLAGFSGGGTMAFRLAMNHPDQFAGVVSVCGGFPSGRRPFGNLVSARQLGMFLITGRGSREYPADAVCNDLRLFHSAGLSVTLRQYPCGHEIVSQMLADIDRWIIEQIAPPHPAAIET